MTRLKKQPNGIKLINSKTQSKSMESKSKNIIIGLISILLAIISSYFLWKDRNIETPINNLGVKPKTAQEQKTLSLSPVSDPNLLLPDLKAEPVSEIYILRDSKTQNREIKFNTIISNLGDGPLEIIGLFDEVTNKTRAIQRIKTRQNEIQERTAGYFAFHPDHEHWHFNDFALLEIFYLNSDNSIGAPTAMSSKQTFCLADESRISPPLPNSPANITYDWECDNNTQGISVGWRDNYEAKLAGQEINIQNAPDGRYLLRSTADPFDRILEKDETNNFSEIRVEISGMRIKIIPSS
ncbi:MAG: hypothetical protein UV67_C0023G0003 [Parcubacteria group bacterium GW2011_GWC1_43_12]|nr:MAG: hypothetical protein UV67_C0023G0003 [Parcubacteria group bacterium GW2011_GWC1_43_12]